ncbi:MAG: hypothetical protein ACKVOL_02935, partial [Novosphingobium sp.]
TTCPRISSSSSFAKQTSGNGWGFREARRIADGGAKGKRGGLPGENALSHARSYSNKVAKVAGLHRFRATSQK